MAYRRLRLVQRRIALGYTQEDLAEKARVDRATIGRWERGTSEPQPWQRPRLARALEVSLDQLDSLLTPVEAGEESGQAADHPQATAPPGRLEYVLAHGGRADAATIGSLREQVARLDAAYDHQPSATLLGPMSERYGQIAYVRMSVGGGRLQDLVLAAFAEAAIVMGQLVWDASLRRNHASALSYFDAAAEAATACGDRVLAARAQLRRGLVALYGQGNPAVGLEMAAQAAATSRAVSNALTGLALLHVAEGHAMRGQTRSCEDALRAAETQLDRVSAHDGAAPLLAPSDVGRMAGSCYLRLGNAPKAATLLAETMRHAGRTKAAGIAAANLALAFVRQGKIDESVGSLHEAIDIVGTTRGGGGLTVAFTAGRALNPWRCDPAVRHVHDRLFTLITP